VKNFNEHNKIVIIKTIVIIIIKIIIIIIVIILFYFCKGKTWTRSKLKYVFPNLVFSVNHMHICRSLNCVHCGSQSSHQQLNWFRRNAFI